jgi:hypothetical protein
MPPREGDWSTEVKFDGWRCQIIIDQGDARVFTRRGHDWTDRLKIVAGAASEELKLKSAIIDGELVYPHETGLSDFHALQAVVRTQSDRLHCCGKSDRWLDLAGGLEYSTGAPLQELVEIGLAARREARQAGKSSRIHENLLVSGINGRLFTTRRHFGPLIATFRFHRFAAWRHLAADAEIPR